MAKASTQYVCSACGATSAKWAGRCDACGAWNTLHEEQQVAARIGRSQAAGKAASTLHFTSLDDDEDPPARMQTRIIEFDRVLGGGIVPGSALLIGGDPGIGKSTLMLQTAAALAGTGQKVAYVSGEESVQQIRLRARRLGVADEAVRLAAGTVLGEILDALAREPELRAVMIDSIQTVYHDGLDAAPGTVSQLRAAADTLIRFAKQREIVLFLVGHVTKDGQIAGPRVLEHMVDTVLYFEGERSHQFRILRAVKNRFGAANEIGVFEMRDIGLVEVPNPSALFLDERDATSAGSVVFAGIEGSRPLLVEIQALVAPTSLGTPRRATVGWDGSRLAMLLAVLETRAGLRLGGSDVYLNVAGGIRIQEPAADLAVAAALVSAASGRPLPERHVVFGEVGLGGEVRPVALTEARLKEASKLGFDRALMPRRRSESDDGSTGIARIGQLPTVLDTGIE
ncbi:MAG: DNA repair protein RadA [Geminicoccaceae bacterium]